MIESVGADKGYCSGRNLKGLEVDRKIEPFIPTQRHNRIGFIENKEFKYDSVRDVYICPSGKELTFIKERKESRVYKAKAIDCNSCRRKKKCTTSKRGRIISCSVFKEQFYNLKERLKSPKAKWSAKIRKTHTERLFSEGKLFHGLRRAKSRGKGNVFKQIITIAAVLNLKRLIKFYKFSESASLMMENFAQSYKKFSLNSKLFRFFDTFMNFILLKFSTLSCCLSLSFNFN